MKTLVSILMTILGILSPALSSRAQEADLFPGEFKEIYSINDFTEGYYLIVTPVENKNDMESMRALTEVVKHNNKNVGQCELLSNTNSATSVTSPIIQAVWKVERSADGKSFAVQNVKAKKYLSSKDVLSNPKKNNNTLNWSDNPEYLPIDSYNPKTPDWGCKFTFSINNSMWFAFNTNKLSRFVFCGRDNRPTQHTHSPRFFKLVQLTISSVKCATFYSEKAMKLPAGLTAHVGEVDAQHGVVHLKAIGSVVPANTAVIITGEPGTYTPTATTEAPQSFAKNDLKGTSTNITASEIAAAPEAYYALSINQGQPCFGILERDLPAGKAYFTQPKSAGAASQFLSGFVISSVQHVQQKAEEGPLYDLNGRAVTQPVKGNIYVRNGKKFIYLH
jgi:hypothetical protein